MSVPADSGEYFEPENVAFGVVSSVAVSAAFGLVAATLTGCYKFSAHVLERFSLPDVSWTSPIMLGVGVGAFCCLNYAVANYRNGGGLRDHPRRKAFVGTAAVTLLGVSALRGFGLM